MPVDHSTQRTKRAKKNVVVMFLIKGISMGISFLYVPLLLHTLNTTDYAIWLTLTSMVSWITMFDVGLGNGLRNRLSVALANNDVRSGKELVSTAYCCIGAFVILLCILFALIYNFLPWDSILNAKNAGINDLNTLVLIVFIAFCMQFALGLINSILFALQMPALSSMLLMIGQLFSFLAVYIMSDFYGEKSLLVLGSTISIIPPIILLISTLILFRFKYKDISPAISKFRKKQVNEIFSVGLKFFMLQLITIILYQSNNLIITHIVDNAAVVDYNISYKYMHILSMLFTIIVTPIWSATTEAYTLGDMDWIKRINTRLIKYGLIFSAIGLFMLIFSPFVYDIWLDKNDLHIDYMTTGLLLIQTVFFIFYSCYGYILNGIGKLKAQMWFTSFFAILYIPSAIILGKIWGLHGILAAFAINSILNLIWSKTQFKKIVDGTASGIWIK